MLLWSRALVPMGTLGRHYNEWKRQACGEKNKAKQQIHFVLRKVRCSATQYRILCKQLIIPTVEKSPFPMPVSRCASPQPCFSPFSFLFQIRSPLHRTHILALISLYSFPEFSLLSFPLFFHNPGNLSVVCNSLVPLFSEDQINWWWRHIRIAIAGKFNDVTVTMPTPLISVNYIA